MRFYNAQKDSAFETISETQNEYIYIWVTLFLKSGGAAPWNAWEEGTSERRRAKNKRVCIFVKAEFSDSLTRWPLVDVSFYVVVVVGFVYASLWVSASSSLLTLNLRSFLGPREPKNNSKKEKGNQRSIFHVIPWKIRSIVFIFLSFNLPNERRHNMYQSLGL